MHRHQRSKENDDGQNVDGETEAYDVGIGQGSEHHVDARVRKTDDGEHTLAQRIDGFLAAAPVQNSSGNSCLQSKRRADDAQVNGFAIAREQDCDSENYDDANNANVTARHGHPR